MALTIIIPVQTEKDGNKTRITHDEVQELTFKELGVTEADLEEFVRQNIEVLFPDGEETLLVVGQQNRNKEGGRADLIALDGDGNIVLIELKRDKQDMVARKEAFEFQAIRYAANYALINTPKDLVQKTYASYIEKYENESQFQEELKQGLSHSELASKRLDHFLQENKAQGTFNRRQRIILMASSFDPQTLSACAWLVKNGVDIRCISVLPIRYNQQVFFNVEQILPPPTLEQYFVELAEPTQKSRKSRREGKKSTLPRMSKLFEWKIVKKHDQIHIKNHESKTATMKDHQYVIYQGKQIKYNDWGQQITGWSAINIYEWTVHEKSGKTLDALRREKLDELEQVGME